MKKKITGVLVLLMVTALAFWAFAKGSRDPAQVYRFVSLDRGDIQSVVSATGTLGATTMVQVGTQVSGILSKIFVDFNDHVREGQVVALIDPTLLQIAVRNAEANLEKSQAQLDQANRDYGRAVALRGQQILSETDYGTAETNLATARASVKASAVALDQAKKNLAYATIYAPISGTVVERDVDVGQTVAASLSAPQLFKIAGDLSSMQILVSVDESDIGHIQEGQTARFKVEAYPTESFVGKVRQVRLQSAVVENVVNYTVVVDVPNADRRLLPGMTATVDFVLGSAHGALRTPNAALRIVPTAAMLAQVGGVQRDKTTATQSRGVAQSRGGRSSVARLFYLDPQGRLAAVRVKTGLTDGQFTQVEGDGLSVGMKVISGMNQATQDAASNPFQAQQRSSRPAGPPGPGF